jgi:ribose transport system ATP-binding protein
MNALVLRHITKTFGDQLALDDVGLEVRAGQIHALLGQNGSGKSTLIKVLSGFHEPDTGAEMTVAGAALDEHGVRRARIRCVHQDLALVETLNAVENLALQDGFARTAWGQVRWAEQRRRTEEVIARLGVTIDVGVPVGRLNPAERTMVAIGRALQAWDPDHFGVLVLDEPTTTLSKPEADRLYAAVRLVARQGAGVILVTHNLDEALRVADHVTVLRDGRVAGDGPTSDLDEDALVQLIIGRSPERLYSAPPPARGEPVLDVSGLSAAGLAPLTFQVAAGEIVGFAGTLGSGRDQVADLVACASVPQSGRVRVGGVTLRPGRLRQAARQGVALVPADRVRKALIPLMSVSENLTLSQLGDLRTGVLGLGRLRRRREAAEVDRWFERLDVRPRTPRRAIKLLSGGNQQKVILARALRTRPRVLVLDEPTQGVDIGARALIYDLVTSAARDGMAVVLCSSDSAELANECDRVVVLREGRVGAELSGDSLTEDAIFAETLARRAPTRAGAPEPEGR